MCQRHFFFNEEKIIIRTKNSDLKRHSNLLSARSITTRQDKKVINYFSIKILHEKQLVIIIFTHLALYVEEDIDDDDEKKTKVYKQHTKKKQKYFRISQTSLSSPISSRTEIHPEKKISLILLLAQKKWLECSQKM